MRLAIEILFEIGPLRANPSMMLVPTLARFSIAALLFFAVLPSAVAQQLSCRGRTYATNWELDPPLDLRILGTLSSATSIDLLTIFIQKNRIVGPTDVRAMDLETLGREPAMAAVPPLQNTGNQAFLAPEQSYLNSGLGTPKLVALLLPEKLKSEMKKFFGVMIYIKNQRHEFSRIECRIRKR